MTMPECIRTGMWCWLAKRSNDVTHGVHTLTYDHCQINLTCPTQQIVPCSSPWDTWMDFPPLDTCLFVTTMVISCLWTVDTVLFPFDLRPRHACVKNYISKHCKLPYMKNAQKYAVICSEYFFSLQIMDQPKKNRPTWRWWNVTARGKSTNPWWMKETTNQQTHIEDFANEHLVTICGEKSRAQAPLCGFGWRRISLTHSTTCLISSRFSPHAF